MSDEMCTSKGYWILRADVFDIEKFNEYASRTPELLAKFGGKFIVRTGRYEVVEGESRSRNLIIEFPSYESAIACWNSHEYQNTKTYRLGAAELDVVVIEGL